MKLKRRMFYNYTIIQTVITKSSKKVDEHEGGPGVSTSFVGRQA